MFLFAICWQRRSFHPRAVRRAIARQTTLANRDNNKFAVIISYARLAMLIARVCAGKMDRHDARQNAEVLVPGREFQTLVRGSFGIA
jgi:hypothetical protein